MSKMSFNGPELDFFLTPYRLPIGARRRLEGDSKLPDVAVESRKTIDSIYLS